MTKELIAATIALLKESKKKYVIFPKKEKILSQKSPKMAEPIFEEMRKWIPKATRNIPSDAEAKRIAYAYRYRNKAADITILELGNINFFKNVALAIDTLITPCRYVSIEEIETQDEWTPFLSSPNLKLILISKSTLTSQKNLMRYYRELPATNEFFLQNIPLLLLHPATTYRQHCEQKRSLWTSLCQKTSAMHLLS